MKKRGISLLLVWILIFAMIPATLSGKAAKADIENQEFACAYSAAKADQEYLVYGSDRVVTMSAQEAKTNGVPDGYQGQVLKVEGGINKGLLLDFSAQKIPTNVIDSIKFRVCVTQSITEVRIMYPKRNGHWAMRYSKIAGVTNQWVDITLGSDGTNFCQSPYMSCLSEDGYLNKFELSVRGNVVNDFYIDSVTVSFKQDDKTAPVIDCYKNTIVVAENASGLDITAHDAYEDRDVDVQYIWPEGIKVGENGIPNPGTYRLILRASDFSGNQAEKTITLIVKEVDTEAPVIQIRRNELKAVVGTIPNLKVAATDNSTAEPAITETWSDGALDEEGRLVSGTHTYTVTATDDAGNRSTKEIAVYVTDTENWTDPIVDEEVNYNTAGHQKKAVTVKAQYKKNGYRTTVCSFCGESMGTKQTIYAPKTVTVSELTYIGKSQTAKVSVKDAKGKLIPASNYSVTGNKQKNPGSYTVTVTFKKTSENYTGKITGKCKVSVAPTKLTKVSAGSGKLTVKWTKPTKKVTGYQISYSTKKNFKGAKTVNVSGKNKTSVTLKKLKPKTTYYVRIRSCYKSGKKTCYSAWSTKKQQTTKN